MNNKAADVPGREGIDNFFPAKLNLEKKGYREFYLPLSSRHHRQRSGPANHGKDTNPLGAPASFPRVPSAGSRESGGAPVGLILIPDPVQTKSDPVQPWTQPSF